MKVFIRLQVIGLYFPAFLLSLCMMPSASNAQCVPPVLTFHSPVLISGVDGQVGAKYNFANVTPGVDAVVEIMGMTGGATLSNIDDTTGLGYYNAFQPYVGAGAATTSYIDWRFTFKKAGTNIDTTFACLAVTGIDVDGDGSALQEFIEAATPGSIAVDPFTNLTVSFDGVRSKAVSPVANIPNIDTAHHEGMFQMNFTNINTLDYRNGAITSGGAQVRQTCIYFMSFFQTFQLLENTLSSFTANSINETIQLNWSALEESSIDHYTLQRSEAGSAWKNIGNFPVRSSSRKNDYVVNDFTKLTHTTYYRLMVTTNTGSTKYSHVAMLQPKKSSVGSIFHNTIFTNKLSVTIIAAKSDDYHLYIYSLQGAVINKLRQRINAGTNISTIDLSPSLLRGLYLLEIKNANGLVHYQAKLIKL